MVGVAMQEVMNLGMDIKRCSVEWWEGELHIDNVGVYERGRVEEVYVIDCGQDLKGRSKLRTKTLPSLI